MFRKSNSIAQAHHVPSLSQNLDTIVYEIHSFDSIGSTSVYLRTLAENGAPQGTVVDAKSQTEGKGRYGRKWLSPQGNVCFSLLLRPEGDVIRISQLSFVAALSVGASIRELLPAHATCHYKWPNDILLNGKKAAGILLESSLIAHKESVEWLAIGIGVNVKNHPTENGIIATSMEAAGIAVNSISLRDKILAWFQHYYNLWLKEGFVPIQKEWLENAAYRNEAITVTTANKELKGTMMGISVEGELMLRLEDGAMRFITSGEVFFA